MPLYTTLAALSQTPASNPPDGTVDAPSTIDDQLRLLGAFIAQLRDGAAPNLSSFTTSGTATAYTATPSFAIAAYSANQAFWVKFHTACGVNPTLQISGLASPPALVKMQADGSVAGLSANDIQAGTASYVVLLSPSQALVVGLPAQGAIGQLFLTVNTTLTASAGGKSVIGNSASPISVTLPLTSAVATGSRIVLLNQGSGPMTVVRQGADVIWMPGSLTSIVLNYGDSLFLESFSGGSWIATGGTAQEQYATLWGNSKASNGYAKLPSGLILQWGTGTAGATGTGFFNALPIAFPNAAFAAVACHVGSFDSVNIITRSLSTTQVEFGSSWTGIASVMYFAIGY